MKRPLRNLGALLASDAGSRIIGFLVTAYLARVLAPSAFGVLNIGLSSLGILMILGSPGIQVVESRNVAARREGLEGRMGGVIVIRLLLAVVLIGLTWIVTAVAVSSEETREVIRLYALSLVPYAILLDWYFQGKEEFLRLGFSRVLMYAVFSIAVVVLVRSAGDVRYAPIAFLAGNVVAALFLGLSAAALVRRAWPAWDTELWATILRDNLPVGFALLLAQLVSNLPPLAVGFILGERETGMYSAALKLVFLLLVLDRLFNALFLPVVTRYFVARRAEVTQLLGMTTKALATMLLPATAAAVFLAPEVIRLVFGPGYDDAVPLFRVMTGFVLCTVLNSVFVCVLVGSGRERVYSRAMVVGTGVLVVAVLVLTPALGTIGTSLALVIGECTTLGLMTRGAREAVELPSAWLLTRPLLAGAAMSGALWVLKSSGSAVALSAGIATFVVVMSVPGGITREEVRFFRERLL